MIDRLAGEGGSVRTGAIDVGMTLEPVVRSGAGMVVTELL